MTEPTERTDHLVAWVVLVRGDGAVPLARRSGVAYGEGLWGLPGGHVEDDEGLAAGATREVAEEVGLDVDPDDLAPCGVTRWVDGEHRGTDVFFVARSWRGEPAPVLECSQVAWHDPRELPADVLPWLPRALHRHLLDGVWLDDHPAG